MHSDAHVTSDYLQHNHLLVLTQAAMSAFRFMQMTPSLPSLPTMLTRMVGNCPPTPPLTHHFAQSVDVSLGEG